MPNPRLQQIILSRRRQLYEDAETEIRELQRLLGLSRGDVVELLRELEGRQARYGELGNARLLRDATVALAGAGMLWAALRGEMRGVYTSTVGRGWQLGLEAVDAISAHMGEIAPRAISMVDALRDNVIPFADKQTLAIESQIRGELVRGILDGDRVSALSNRLVGAGLGTEGTPWKSALARAETTIETETSRAYHSALTSNFEQADWVYGFQYVTMPEGPWPCQICAPFHGRVFEKGTQPSLPLHPRGRCYYLVVTKKYGAYDLTGLE